MAIASSSRVGIYYVKEVTYGVIPGTPAVKTLRRVPGGGGLVRNSNIVSSEEADASRTIPDQSETGYSAALDFNFELSGGGTFDDFFVAILGGTTYPVNYTASTIAAVASGNKLTDSAGGGQFIANGIKPGMWIKVSGFTAGGVPNNKLMRVKDGAGDVAAGQINIDPATATIADKTAGDNVSIKAKMVRTGTANQDSFSFEQNFSDLTNIWLRGTGMRPTGMSLDATAGSKVTGSFNFLGQAITTAAAAFTGETGPTVTTTQIMNATSNVANLYEGAIGSQAAIATLARQVTINVNPNVTELRALANAAAAGLIDGTFDISVGLNLYFSDLSYITKVINRTPTGLYLPFSDAAGNHVIFSFPTGYLSGTPKEQGQNTPVAQDLTFTPVRYTGYTLTPSMMMQIDMPS